MIGDLIAEALLRLVGEIIILGIHCRDKFCQYSLKLVCIIK